MMLRCISRSVRRQTQKLTCPSYSTAPIPINYCSGGVYKMQKCGSNRNNISNGVLNLNSFEERVFFSTGRKSYTDENHEKHQQLQHQHQQMVKLENGNDQREATSTAVVEEAYEQAIKALNTLQPNADSQQRSITKPTCLNDTLKYLYRSGITLDDLDKLSIIHVSGTKGKGTTCALTESILRAYGAKTGFFSSPHLISVTERICINGVSISKAYFTRTFWHVFNKLKAAQDDPYDMPIYFNFLTVLCFYVFLEQKVDVAVLEVGIGGELDCTNIVRNTKTVGITSLGLEHTLILGNTLEEIAWQKAGIIKPYSDVFTTVTQPECLEVIRKRAAEKNATVHIVPNFADYFTDEASKATLTKLNNVTQLNSSLAIQLAYDWLRKQKNGLHHNFALNSTQLPEKVLSAISNCNWPGRCQLVKYYNLNIHLDGAHTIDSMHICSDWFHKVSAHSSNPKVLIFNTTGDRDSRKLLDILYHRTHFSLVCFVPNVAFGSEDKDDLKMTKFGLCEQLRRAHLHASNWHLLCQEAGETDNSRVFDTVYDSFKYLDKHFGTDQNLDILVTGSLHLIGASVLALNNYTRSVQ